MYGSLPVLQTIPSLVVTYPTISQVEHQSELDNFPAKWHTDYAGEFTVHLPLTDITASTSHTAYIRGSAKGYLPLKAPNSSTSAVNPFFGYASKGDALFLDVCGLHRANIRAGLRAMIQIKYTLGNDLLYFDRKNSKYRSNLMRLKKHTSIFPQIVQTFSTQVDQLNPSTFPSAHEKLIAQAEETRHILFSIAESQDPATA